MKIEFGEINDDGNAESVQQIINDCFVNLKNIKGYETLYVAIPHANNFNVFKPARKSKNRLELYICATPTITRCNEFIGQNNSLKFAGTTYAFEVGQCDVLAYDRKIIYDEMQDDNGTIFAVKYDNQVWVLQDLLHPTFKRDVTINVIRELCKFIEGEAKFYDPTDMIKNAMQKINEDQIRRFEENLAEIRRRVADAQSAFTSRLRELSDFNRERVKLMTDDGTLAEAMTKRIMKMSIIERIGKHAEIRNGIQILTKDIIRGPFNFGKWIISIGPGLDPTFGIEPANMIGSAEEKVKHPHDTSDTQGKCRACIGGFAEEIIRSQETGEWDTTITYYVMWVTNYTSAERLTELEKFLEATMGKKAFNDAYDNLLKKSQINKETHTGVSISSLYGNEMTIIGTRKDNGAVDRDVIIL